MATSIMEKQYYSPFLASFTKDYAVPLTVVSVMICTCGILTNLINIVVLTRFCYFPLLSSP